MLTRMHVCTSMYTQERLKKYASNCLQFSFGVGEGGVYIQCSFRFFPPQTDYFVILKTKYIRKCLGREKGWSCPSDTAHGRLGSKFKAGSTPDHGLQLLKGGARNTQRFLGGFESRDSGTLKSEV